MVGKKASLFATTELKLYSILNVSDKIWMDQIPDFINDAILIEQLALSFLL
jgi:hypothetical protein